MLNFFKTKIAIWQKNISLKAVALYLKILNLFNKKKSEKLFIYPYIEIDILEAFSKLNIHHTSDLKQQKRLFKLLGYLKKFTLIGDNWTSEDKKPIAMLWGFNTWKLGFVSDYLPEYRTVFTPRKFLNIGVLRAVYKFPEKPSVFIVWGYTESFWVKCASKLFRVPIYRMEDGFVRSVELGANHSTPYSLVLDRKGLYYNGYEPSDLEHILNHIDLSYNKTLAEQASRTLKMLLEYDISKYNLPHIDKKSGFVFGNKKRILVIGQVDNDASLRYGNPYKYTMEQIVKIAKYENPLADVLYRPHPEVYKGFQKSKFRKNKIEAFAEVVSPDIPLPDILKTTDHVYVITSLAGMEALLRDIPVTVLGTPFYAGWGLTDDRALSKKSSFVQRRTKKLTKLELFAGAYLKYPRYLADLENVEVGLEVGVLRIDVEREILTQQYISSIEIDTTEKAVKVAQSPYWIQLFLKKNIANEHLNNNLLSSVFDDLNIEHLFMEDISIIQKMTVLYMFCGMVKDDVLRDRIFHKYKKFVDVLNFEDFIKNTNAYYPGKYLVSHIYNILYEKEGSSSALSFLYKEFYQDISDTELKESLSFEQLEILKQLLDYHIEYKDFQSALELAYTLLLNGCVEARILSQIAKIAELKFDYQTAYNIAFLSRSIDIFTEASKSTSLQLVNFVLEDKKDIRNYLKQLGLYVLLKPEKIDNAVLLLNKHEDILNIDYVSNLIEKMLFLDNKQTVQKSKAFIAINRTDKALKIMKNIVISKEDVNYKDYVVYSQALSFDGKLKEAIEVMDFIQQQKINSLVYSESLRLCILANDYTKGLVLLNQAINYKLDLGDMLPRKIYFGARMIGQAFEQFLYFNLAKTLSCYYLTKYFSKEKELEDMIGKSIVMLNIFGPGDEIRFASIYNLLKKFPFKSITISCDPRLYDLCVRSFSQSSFVSVVRIRHNQKFNIENYDKLLGSDLTGVLDNNGVEVIDKSDHVMLLTDMLCRCLKDYSSFSGKAYLKHDEIKSMNFMSRLLKMKKSQDKLLVGLSWRSSLTTHSRNEHYLTIEELEPIFRIDGIQFVNFQYDECSEELAWIEQRYPNKMIHFSDIDHYNDLDSVASLMKCMDLMIAPATTVVELAGALGCPTWLLSNSSELYWRKIDDKGTDVWHNSITHIEGILGDKESLVKNVEVCLRELLKNTQKINHFVA